MSIYPATEKDLTEALDAWAKMLLAYKPVQKQEKNIKDARNYHLLNSITKRS